MTIDSTLLVASKTLQQFLLDKDTGLPLAAGVITLYKDNNRVELKNWYYRTGEPGAYTYLTLDNPLTLNGSGAIVDPSGNEINPYYYPYSETSTATEELYYITVDNADGTRQFTRVGWPPEFTGSGPENSTDKKNLIVNNRFWNGGFGIGTQSSPGAGAETTVVVQDQPFPQNFVLCGSKHDGFQEPDFRFKKGKSGAIETIEFKRFLTTEDNFTDDVMPQFYINAQCTGAETNENYKYFQFPICLNLRNLEGQKAIATLQAKSAGPADASKITLAIFKSVGSSTGIEDIGTLQKEFTIGSNWDQLQWKFTFPALDAGDIIAETKDDAYYFQIGMPVDSTYNLSFALPSIYLGSTAPIDNFESYSDSDAIVFTPRTGDFRTSLNYFNNFGWVAASNKTIGSINSGADIKSTYVWPLYKLLWNNISDEYAPILTSAGLPSSRGSNPYDDFVVQNKRITITKNLGRVLIGGNPQFDTNVAFTVNISPLVYTFSGVTLTVSSTSNLSVGQPVQFSSTGTLPSELSASTTYYVSAANFTATTFEIAPTLVDALASSNSISLSGGSGTQSVVNTDNTLTLGTATSGLVAGTPVTVTASGNTLPETLQENTVYYISSSDLSTGTVRLSLHLTDALNGYYEPITTAGTGPFLLRPALGASTGTSYQTEPPRHRHSISPPQNNLDYTINFNRPSDGSGADANPWSDPVTDYTGQEKMSLVQPGAVANVFLKL